MDFKHVIALLLLVVFTGGCAVLGVGAYMAGGNLIKPIYNLTDQATVVLVDDPEGQLGDPAMAGVIAAEVGFQLQHHGLIKDVVDQSQVVKLMSRQGAAYNKMAVAAVGKEVGAAQVIHVLVEAVTAQGDPGQLKPTAQVAVKLIDVTNNRRLYPPPHASDVAGVAVIGHERGHVVTVRIAEKTSDKTSPERMPILRRRLSERIGRAVAELFYEHEPPTLLTEES
ncbi:MAG: hypothetical protein WD042_19100 [Phycisphaeraceae bacterium]